MDKGKPMLRGEKSDLLGIAGLLPTVPHGDDRDKLLWHIIAESAPKSAGPLLDDFRLAQQLPSRLGLGLEASRVAAEALKQRFFSSRTASTMLAVHAALPLNYRHARLRNGKSIPVGYKMFDGKVLPYLLWDSGSDGISEQVIQSLLDGAATSNELTILDRRFLDIALEEAPRPNAVPDARELVSRYEKELAAEFQSRGGPFCEPSLALFRRDLETVLATELPRPERAEWLTILISLHLALRLYRIAVALGGDIDRVIAASAQIPPPPGAQGCSCIGRDPEQLQSCALAGLLRFRTGSGHFRRVQGTDGCRAAYVEVDRRRLLDLLPTLITRNLASRAWQALGGGAAAERNDMRALAIALGSDRDLRRSMGAAAAAMAVLHHDACRKGESTREELEHASRTSDTLPGLHALREDIRHMRSRDLRRISSSVVNSLMLKGTVGRGSLISRNGPSYGYFEIDEQLLVLLVRLVCVDREVPFDTFLRELRAYGLAPQDDTERDALANTLERLGLLDRYSDAGEASFVHYA
ncbi:DNA phosphorothioation-dependent restriction protein DptG (plasmid) [Kribbella sp. CWNU-51]